uniref:peptidylprolyl isomerase n=1 Tax=Wollemia nobilis TaxID=56998 RepID=A0A0C9S6Z9_9CONI
MAASIFLGAPSNLFAHRSLPRLHSDSKFSIKCRPGHLIKMECNKTREAKAQKIRAEETLAIRRRGILALACFAGSAGALQATEAQVAKAQVGGSCQFTIAASGLGFCDTLIGTGMEASQGQLIKAHYTGKLENGKVFDSSYNRGKPLTFRIGVGEVIKGWDEGILGSAGIPPMLAGGKRTLKIPPELAYGVRGAGCREGSCIIPPNSVLLFDLEFVGKA